MSYNTGQSQFGRGNIWAMIKKLVEGQASINASDQAGAGGYQLAKATYDFSVDGGAVGAIELASSIVIPANAIIMGGLIDGITLPTSGGAATIAVGLGTGAQAAALKAATAIASYTAGGLISIVPVWTAATAVKVTVDSKISITVATAALTVGKFAINIVYHMAGE
jgi:hypothetical protein